MKKPNTLSGQALITGARQAFTKETVTLAVGMSGRKVDLVTRPSAAPISMPPEVARKLAWALEHYADAIDRKGTRRSDMRRDCFMRRLFK